MLVFVIWVGMWVNILVLGEALIVGKIRQGYLDFKYVIEVVMIYRAG